MKIRTNSAGYSYWVPSKPDILDPLPARAAYTAMETAHLLGGISLRSLRRLEQRGLLLPSRGLRIKLYSIKAIEQYLEETK